LEDATELMVTPAASGVEDAEGQEQTITATLKPKADRHRERNDDGGIYGTRPT